MSFAVQIWVVLQNKYIYSYIYIVLFCDDPRFLNKQVGFVTVKAVKL